MRFQRLFVLLLIVLLGLPAGASAVSSWTPLGPFGGSANAITADPVHAGVLYAATTQGVYKTADAGGSWSLIHPGYGGRLAVDPLHPSTLYLTATQEAPVVKSVDGGAHWFPSAKGLPNYYSTLTVDPARPRRLYVAPDSGGLWRSVDAGASWQRVGEESLQSSFIQATAAASRPAGKVFATTLQGLYRSTDGGATWTPAAGLPQNYAYAVAFAPSDPRTAYVYFDRAGYSPKSGGLYRSTDGGASWRRVLKAWPSPAAEISISPASPRIVYVQFSDLAVFRSTDGGDHWTQLPSSRITAVAADPFSASTVWSSLLTGPNLGGVWRSANQGKTWEARSQGMTGVWTTSLAIDPANLDRLWITYAATPLRTANGGARWLGGRMPAGENGMPQVAAGAGGAIYALTWKNPGSHSDLPLYSLWKTTSDGASWTRLLGPSGSLDEFRLAPSDPATIYTRDFGNPQYIHRSTDGGAHWAARPAPALTCGVGTLAVAPSRAAVIYLAGCKDPGAAVLRSGDGGDHFTDVSAGLSGGFVRALAVDPRDPNTVWAGTGYALYEVPGDGVWKTANGGVSWTRAGSELAGLTITALLAPDVPGRVYAAALDGRIFRSEDGGATWDDWSNGLPPSQVSALETAPDDPRRIYAVTTQGIWLLNEAD